MAPAITRAYLDGVARAFYGAHYADPADRRRAVERAARPMHASVLAALRAQNARLAPSPAREASLRALADGARAVVTGQQVGLFTGPLFTLYKAATAVRVARALSQETGDPVVPVFWLQTEDHDLPEVATTHALTAGGASLTLSLPAPPDGRVSLAHLTLPPEVETCLSALGHALADQPHAEEHLALLGRCYAPGAAWSSAFAGVIGALFADAGLVLVDPRDAALAELAAPVHARAFADAEPLAARLMQRGAELEAAGFAPNVHVRADSPLSFFHPEGPEGPRYRLQAEGEVLLEIGGTGRHTRRAILERLQREPSSVSSSALLRPIVQDTLLPTAAYVGGPAEVAYFAQVAPLYDAFALPMPLVVPRAHLRLVEPRAARLLAQLSLRPADVERSEEELVARTSEGARSVAPSADEVRAAIAGPVTQALAEIAARFPELAADLERPRAKTVRSVERSAGRFARKLEALSRGRAGEAAGRVRRLRALLYPEGQPQERWYGMAYFAARLGQDELVRRVLSAATPFETTIKDVES